MAASMKQAKELMEKKDSIEAEIKELHEVLESQKGVGMSGPLIDAEGFPRADIDIYSVRHARHEIICLQNDHRDLMKEIEQCLHEIHAEARESQGETTTQPYNGDRLKPGEVIVQPFAKVDRVDPGSPAAMAGLEVNDEIIQFGSITTENFQTLQNIATAVKHSKGRRLHVTVMREGTKMHLGLTPQTWSGRGLLGCNIVPLKS